MTNVASDRKATALYDVVQMTNPRDLLAPLLESSVASPLRRRIAIQRGRSDAAGTQLSASHRGFQVLTPSDLAPPHGPEKSTELFILGSGPSVLELTPSQLARMRAGTTIGVNSWVLHDFIPDAYSFEEMENDDYVAVAAGLSTALMRPEITAANPLLLHLRSRIDTPTRRLVTIPEHLRDNTRYYGRVTVETRRHKNLERDLVALLRAGRSGALAPHVLIDSGFSVARMASLGILCGYSAIILVGVDLNSSRYFFEEDPSYLARHNLTDFNPWVSRAAVHDTEETTNRHFAASEFLPALARASEAIGGPGLFVGSTSSRLVERVPLFRWEPS